MLLAVMALMALSAVSVVLANEDSGEVIYACVNDKNGKMRIVQSDNACRDGWSLLDWNQQGRPGLSGQDGADGQDGVSGYETVERFWRDIEVQPGDLVSFQTGCPSDKSVLGGGFAFGNVDLGALVVEDSFPVTEEGPHKWRVQWRNISDTAVVDGFQIWATCADVS